MTLSPEAPRYYSKSRKPLEELYVTLNEQGRSYAKRRAKTRPLSGTPVPYFAFVWRFWGLLLQLRLCFSIFWSAGIDMAMKCELCGKVPQYGNVVSHANNTRRRRWNPNLKRVRAVVAGVHKQIRVCTACIRLGRVTKAA